MEQTRAEAPIGAGRTALRPRVPVQGQRGQEQRPQSVGADEDPAARGEHVHSEPPPPAPAVRAPREPAGARLPERHSVRAQILEALRDALLSGELAPGEVYSAPAVADRFGVSATPVREAMQQLVSEGAVETVPNRGFRVARHSPREFAELAEVRALLEVPAVMRAARTLPADSWEGLRPLAEDTLAAAARGDRTAYAAADRAFHGALLELSGNSQLVALADDVHRRAQRRPAPAGRRTCAAELLGEASEHVALLDALQARDFTMAERVLRDHVAV